MRDYIDKVQECLGCENIKNFNFPFTNSSWGGKKGLYINQEGCGVNGQTYLKIKFCPVCGANQVEV